MVFVIGIVIKIIMMITSVPIYALCESGPLDETPATTAAPAYYKVVTITIPILRCLL